MLFMKTFWTEEEGGKEKKKGGKKEHSGAENSPGWRLPCSAHGLFILWVSAGDLRAKLCVGRRQAGKGLAVTQAAGWSLGGGD